MHTIDQAYSVAGSGHTDYEQSRRPSQSLSATVLYRGLSWQAHAGWDGGMLQFWLAKGANSRVDLSLLPLPMLFRPSSFSFLSWVLLPLLASLHVFTYSPRSSFLISQLLNLSFYILNSTFKTQSTQKSLFSIKKELYHNSKLF